MPASPWTRSTSWFAVFFAGALLGCALLVEFTPLGNYPTMHLLFGGNILHFTLQAAIPLILGALSGILCERSGIVNIGIEGMMLAGAFAAFAAKTATNHWPLLLSLGFSTLATLLSGLLMGYLHAALAIRFRMDQIISGAVLIILAQGTTAFFFDRDALAAGRFAQVPLPLLSDVPVLGPLLFDKPPLTYTALALVLVLGFGLDRTRWGLRTRAVGEHPRAAETMGIDVLRLRYCNTALGGALAALGGGFLVLEAVGQFQAGMIAGRGFIALAAVIFGNWTPLGALGAALLFGYTQAFPHALAATPISLWPRQFISMLPYLVTIVVVSGLAGRVRPPAAVGRPYAPEAIS